MTEYHDEIFSNFASWTPAYQDYIRSSRRKRMHTVSTKAWLIMQDIGPWRIGKTQEMWDLASVVLAVLIKANSTY